ncbi:MAG: hypothetical protein HDT28_09265 [Clostridiales bacterium]|nr:hypothetical protein [Clostridiales bacterium]
MKKLFTTLLALMACVFALFGLGACGGSDGGSGETDGTQPGNSPNGTVNTPTETYVPTAADIVAARKSAVDEKVQGYDFDLTITGDFQVLGLGTALNGKYDGKYRYDGNNDEVAFKRTTSGALLADSTCYVFTSGDNRIKATMDGKDSKVVKKLSIEAVEDQDITMVNLPVVKIVDSANESSISDITTLKNSAYAYSCKLKAGNNNIAYTALNKVFEKLGTGVSFKGITLAEDTSTFDFNIKDGKLNDFKLGMKLQIDVKAVKVVVSVDYTQRGNSTEISLPDTANIAYKAADIQAEVSKINAAVADIKDDPVYSLDLTAENEFDPGWNKLAIVDSYTARMYKKTEDGVDWFNHSYYYKAHSETAGKETYKYTLGNVNGEDADNQGSWLISRKSKNTQTRADGVTAATQFDFLTSVVKQTASEIDCIKKQVTGTTVTYSVYLGKAATKTVQEKIVAMINTNSYEDVIEVENYFNTENVIKDASLVVVVTDGKISSIVCDTELCYNPTGGEYTEYNITLNNKIDLQVNKNLDKANKYEIPDKVKGNAIGWGNNLNDSEYYIL